MSEIENSIQDKVLPEHKDIVGKFRKLIRNKYPDVREELRGGTDSYYGVPVYKLNRTLITLSPTKKGITFNFSEGAKFEDRYQQLEGKGNKTLSLRLTNIDQFDDQQFQYYIDQAIILDSRV